MKIVIQSTYSFFLIVKSFHNNASAVMQTVKMVQCAAVHLPAQHNSAKYRSTIFYLSQHCTSFININHLEYSTYNAIREII